MYKEIVQTLEVSMEGCNAEQLDDSVILRRENHEKN
jgi:hypothetical protein